MGTHTAQVRWALDPGVDNDDFVRGKYSRAHSWVFDGGVTVPGSPDPAVVRTPWSDPSAVDPEEALVASASSCHMMTFLWLASKAGHVVTRYTDEASGEMTTNDAGAGYISAITLNVSIEYAAGTRPSAEEESALHHAAHEQCPIANSIVAGVTIRSVGR